MYLSQISNMAVGLEPQENVLKIVRFAETFWNLGQSWRRPSLDWGNWPRVCHKTWLWFLWLPQDLGNNYDHCEWHLIIRLWMIRKWLQIWQDAHLKSFPSHVEEDGAVRLALLRLARAMSKVRKWDMGNNSTLTIINYQKKRWEAGRTCIFVRFRGENPSGSTRRFLTGGKIINTRHSSLSHYNCLFYITMIIITW